VKPKPSLTVGLLPHPTLLANARPTALSKQCPVLPASWLAKSRTVLG